MANRRWNIQIRKKFLSGGQAKLDANKDGKITKADILMGRGVIGKKKKKNKKMTAAKSPMSNMVRKS